MIIKRVIARFGVGIVVLLLQGRKFLGIVFILIRSPKFPSILKDLPLG